jgi:hypothetical protein
LKIKATSTTLVRGHDTLVFDLKLKKPMALIDYYSNNEFQYQLQCPVNQADRVYKQSIYEGYIEHVSATHSVIK